MNLDEILELYDDDREFIDRYFCGTVVSFRNNNTGREDPFFCLGSVGSEGENFMEGNLLSAASNRTQRVSLHSLHPFYPGPRMVNSRGNGFYVTTNMGGGSWRRSVVPSSLSALSLVRLDTLHLLGDMGAQAISNYPRGVPFRNITPRTDTSAWYSEVWASLWGNKDYPHPMTGYEAIMEGKSVSCAVSPTEALVMGDEHHDIYVNHRGYIVGHYDGGKAYLDPNAQDLVEQISMWTDTEVAA